MKQIDYDYSLLNTEEFNSISSIENKENIGSNLDNHNIHIDESKPESNENNDIKERANIFRSF